LTLFSLDCPPAVYTAAALQAVAHVVAKAEPATNMKIEANTSWQQVMTDIRDFMVGLLPDPVCTFAPADLTPSHATVQHHRSGLVRSTERRAAGLNASC
jgi:hypothetical protein